MGSSIEEQLPVDNWDSDNSWACREKYFLFLRDHNLRHAWKPTNDHTVYVNDLFDYAQFFDKLNSFTKVKHFKELWHQWRKANAQYLDPIKTADTIISNVLSNQSYNTTCITDVWTQAVVYYYIWLKFGIEVPHNDFVDFFSDTKQITELVT